MTARGLARGHAGAVATIVATALVASGCSRAPDGETSREEPPGQVMIREAPPRSAARIIETGTRTERIQMRQSDIAAMAACKLNSEGRDVSSIREEDVAHAMAALSESPELLRPCRESLVEAEGRMREGNPPAR